MLARRLLVVVVFAPLVVGPGAGSPPDGFTARHILPPDEPAQEVDDPPGLADANPDLDVVADRLFKKGRYQDALAAYARWKPRSFCANCAFAMREKRYLRMALCQAHLGNHRAAVKVCLEALRGETWHHEVAEFLAQLYATSGQLDDLGPLLDATERQVLAGKHPKWWLLSPKERVELLGFSPLYQARKKLGTARAGQLAPWPAGVPKPAFGSLPETRPQ
ncbi:MAG: hypothetical protein K2V38_03860 [Gemmataceae bacterium]|nr:hypothetical protein [Gemmataceae bacterium]